MTFLFKSRQTLANRQIIDRLNEGIVAAVRQPVFFAQGGIPDTFAGRFELLVLHAALVLRRLRALPAPGPAVAQDLVDTIFRNLDPTLRELGVGDITVPKRMKKLAEAFLGRSVAYDAALASPEASALADALGRNVFGGTPPAPGFAAYVAAAAAALDDAALEPMLAGPLPFPDAAAFMAEDKP